LLASGAPFRTWRQTAEFPLDPLLPFAITRCSLTSARKIGVSADFAAVSGGNLALLAQITSPFPHNVWLEVHQLNPTTQRDPHPLSLLVARFHCSSEQPSKVDNLLHYLLRYTLCRYQHRVVNLLLAVSA